MSALAFTPEATRSVLEGLNPPKSVRPDGVHPSLVKVLADVSTAALFNRSLVDGNPADWKEAEVVPPSKKDEYRDVGDY